MMNFITGIVAIVGLGVFLSIMVWWVPAPPLIIIVVGVMLLLLIDFVQSLRGNGGRG